MQLQAAASAPTRKARRTDESFGPPPIPLDDLKCCDCAYCGRELVGPSHRKYAHHFGMMVAQMVHGRPYCPTCSQTATSRRFVCMTCKVNTPCIGVEFQNGIPYCLKCAEERLPLWRNIENNDRRATPPPGARNDAVEMHATAVSA